LPDLAKLFQTELQDDKDFIGGVPSHQNSSLNSDQPADIVVVDNIPGSWTAEVVEEAEIPKEEAQLKDR
jgi:hypothetical protein